MIDNKDLRSLVSVLSNLLWNKLLQERGRGGGGGYNKPEKRWDNKMVSIANISTAEGYAEQYRITVQIEPLEDDHKDSFWLQHIGRHDDKTVIIDNKHYRIGEASTPRAYSGFGGRKFDIEFNDGRKVTTHNLWHQGTIPPKWRDRLPNNAKFV